MTLPKPYVAFDAEADSCEQQRSESRSNLFVAAVLCHGEGSTPVRIRNMSRGGALVECAAPPSVQSAVELFRGRLSARGRIAWQQGDRAGIRFDEDVDVADWLPNSSCPEAQTQVDAMVHACRSLAASGLHLPPSPALAMTNMEVARQLLGLRDSLNQAAEELAEVAAIAAGHAHALQAIDLTAHRLEKLAGFLSRRGGQTPPSTGS